MGLGHLGGTRGNVWGMIFNACVRNDTVNNVIASSGLSVTAFQMFFFAGFAFAAAAAFGAYAARYKMVDNYRTA